MYAQATEARVYINDKASSLCQGLRLVFSEPGDDVPVELLQILASYRFTVDRVGNHDDVRAMLLERGFREQPDRKPPNRRRQSHSESSKDE